MPRRDDDLFDAPSIIPDNDTLRARQPAGRPTEPKRSSNSTAPARSTGWLGQMVMGLCLIGLAGLAGYFHYRETQQAMLNALLQQRLAVVESQLGLGNTPTAEAGETLDIKVKSLDEKQKSADSEIRKLWAITNDKNRKAIESHESTLAEHSKTLDALQGHVTELKKSLAQAEKSAADAARAANEVKQGLADTTNAVADMRSSVGALQQRLSQADPQTLEATRQAALALDQAEQLQVKLESLNQKVSSHDESLRSIDTFRRSVNSDLNKLKQQSLGGGATSAPPYGQ